MAKKQKSGTAKKIIVGIAALYFGSAALTGIFDETPDTGNNKTQITTEADQKTELNNRSSSSIFDKTETKVRPETEAKPETKAQETKAPETEAPETEAPETEAPETEAPETNPPETNPPETNPPETKEPETKAPETKPPETKPPETKPPETKAPETKPPETKPPKTVTITNKDSSLSPELVETLEGVAAFWAPTGTKIHLNPFCWSFKGVVYAGTVEEANSVKSGGWCGSCSKGANENTKSNKNATPEVIANCYSYQDYLNQIPASAFD